VSEPEEVGGSDYTRGSGPDAPSGWDTVSVPFEWVASDGSSGPIRDGVIFGGIADGLRVAPPRPLVPFTVDSSKIKVRVVTGGKS
jgi:hypothetical protein